MLAEAASRFGLRHAWQRMVAMQAEFRKLALRSGHILSFSVLGRNIQDQDWICPISVLSAPQTMMRSWASRILSPTEDMNNSTTHACPCFLYLHCGFTM
jgi:hypothetical protein